MRAKILDYAIEYAGFLNDFMREIAGSCEICEKLRFMRKAAKYAGTENKIDSSPTPCYKATTEWKRAILKTSYDKQEAY